MGTGASIFLNRYTVLCCVVMIALAGCATAHKLNRVAIGQTKADVIVAMGEPTTVSARGGVEYFHYGLFDSGFQAYMSRGQAPSRYAVRFVDGRVDAYGREQHVIATPARIEWDVREQK